MQDSLEVVKLAAKFANPELIERVTALNEQVLALSTKNVEFQQQVFQLEKELQKVNEKLNLVGEVERSEGFIYLKTEPDRNAAIGTAGQASPFADNHSMRNCSVS